ncbi:MAG: GTPase ObgE [Candidatus Omnitrophota bacterium]|nr:MAG: GTPase ObgE [Candidatus Omnitrophota bacterium]
MFVDEARIFVKGGKGGDGCNSWVRNRRGKRIPTGGSGGRGGNVIIKADPHLSTLADFHYKQYYFAQKGGRGGSNYKQGKEGEDCIIRVPVGTVIFDARDNCLLRDLATPESEVVVAYGGKGGAGNVHQIAQQGEEGEERELKLELKLVADGGIIGYPNSGKSTLISRLSNVKPKIADYPFTTLAPVLGVLKGKKEIVICEIPGLIKGASKGKGLGTLFLRHIERTKFLIHLIDLSQINPQDPLSTFNSLNKELEAYNKDLLSKKQIIVLNKIDLLEAKRNIALFNSKIKQQTYPISAFTGEGIERLKKVLEDSV